MESARLPCSLYSVVDFNCSLRIGCCDTVIIGSVIIVERTLCGKAVLSEHTNQITPPPSARAGSASRTGDCRFATQLSAPHCRRLYKYRAPVPQTSVSHLASVPLAPIQPHTVPQGDARTCVRARMGRAGHVGEKKLPFAPKETASKPNRHRSLTVCFGV